MESNKLEMPIFKEEWSNLPDEEKRWLVIISKKYFCMSYSQIFKSFGILKGTTSKIWTKYQELNTAADLRKFNLRPEISSKVIEQNIQTVKNEPFISSRQLGKRKYPFNDYSHVTMCKYLKLVDFKKGIPLERPQLTDKNKEARIIYCKVHLNDKFSNILFIDESIFQLFDNKKAVWYKIGEKPEIEQKNPNYKIMI